jgi:hypothetical protein
LAYVLVYIVKKASGRYGDRSHTNTPDEK